MVCLAIGRCRICARQHKMPIFGSEKNQHALIEIVNLRLIVSSSLNHENCLSYRAISFLNAPVKTVSETSVPEHPVLSQYQKL